MTSNTPNRALPNLPLIGTWVGAIALLGVGLWLLNSSNATQVELYTAQSQDYAAYLGAQTGTTIGGLLVAVGALALVIAAATQAVAWAVTRAAQADAAVLVEFDEDDALEEIEVEVAAPVAPAPAEAPAAEQAEPAVPAAESAAPADTDNSK